MPTKEEKMYIFFSYRLSQTQGNNKRHEVVISLSNHIEIEKLLTFLFSLELKEFLIVGESQRNVQWKLMRKQSSGKVQILLQLTVYNTV